MVCDALFHFVHRAEVVEQADDFEFRLLRSRFNLPETFLIEWKLTPALTWNRERRSDPI